MTYEEFLNFVPSKCVYETIYDDSDGRTILVIRLLDAFSMVNKAQREWVGLTDEEIDQGLLRTNYAIQTAKAWRDGVEWAQSQLKDKNT